MLFLIIVLFSSIDSLFLCFFVPLNKDIILFNANFKLYVISSAKKGEKTAVAVLKKHNFY